MKRLTIKTVNKVLAKHGFELVKGDGYFYYSPLTDDAPSLTQEGLYGTTRLNGYTLEYLERELLERIEDSKMPKYSGGFFKNK
jgi:hypothetical protein